MGYVRPVVLTLIVLLSPAVALAQAKLFDFSWQSSEVYVVDPHEAHSLYSFAGMGPATLTPLPNGGFSFSFTSDGYNPPRGTGSAILGPPSSYSTPDFAWGSIVSMAFPTLDGVPPLPDGWGTYYRHAPSGSAPESISVGYAVVGPCFGSGCAYYGITSAVYGFSGEGYLVSEETTAAAEPASLVFTAVGLAVAGFLRRGRSIRSMTRQVFAGTGKVA